ncbi:prepilin peptidase [Amycolatopsis alkalitolerans]|uniref:Prepilin peptidase n=1 Tax=Amycolatopsis alkalitolerans TaxID=2547244 RepID=A0A5C4MDG2_9PSEU|nr:A24 family peptidase [Amycolatopsis alkalitolerans]TNC29573.1 prepilin peptidase [Amycolatopsis alkalitolerans]
MTVLLLLVSVAGLVTGSFLTVVVHRLPRGESLITPPSRCPACGHRIRARHNVPVLGWLLRRGRCADCGAPIAARYPVIELGTGLSFLVVTAKMTGIGLTSALPAYLYLTAVSIALVAIDLEHRRLPNALVIPSCVVMAVLLAVCSAYRGAWWPLGRGLVGGALLCAAFWLIAVLFPHAMGFGDVRLAGLLGGALTYLSWAALVVGALAGFAFGALFGVVLLATGRGDRKTAVPFAPFMVAGAYLGTFAGDAIAVWYSGLFGV